MLFKNIKKSIEKELNIINSKSEAIDAEFKKQDERIDQNLKNMKEWDKNTKLIRKR